MLVSRLEAEYKAVNDEKDKAQKEVADLRAKVSLGLVIMWVALVCHDAMFWHEYIARASLSDWS